MRKGKGRSGLAAVLVCLLVATLCAPSVQARGTVILKMATPAPDGTIWHKALMEMGEEWKNATEGTVTLRVYAGGVAGDESATVRKMRIGQLDAATLTVAGLSEIDPAFQVLGMPLFYESYQELDHVLAALEPTLKSKLESKGYVFLGWAYAGWAYFFSTEPVRQAGDLKKLKIFTSAGEDRMVQLYKDNGFRPVALSPTDILVGLETGMIEALPTPPLAALLLQWFRATPYMLDEGLAPVVGCFVASQRGWNKVPAGHQQTLMRAAGGATKRLRNEVPGQDAKSLEEMKSRGLTVTKLEGLRAEEWHALATEFAEKMRGKLVPQDIFDVAVKARSEFRKQASSAGGSD
jgi:TRAP-type C4-dicarboxylate transport system substrate-binding protein